MIDRRLVGWSRRERFAPVFAPSVIQCTMITVDHQFTMCNSERRKYVACLLAVLGCSLSTGSFAQWAANAPFPGGARLAASGFTLAGNAYVVGGLKLQGGNYVGFNDLWRYNEPMDAWTELDPYPAGNMYGGIAFVIDGIAYVGLGGNQNGILSNKLWAFDPVSEQWSARADFPGLKRVYPFCFTADEKGYFGAGVRFVNGDPVYEQDVWMYDPAVDAWTTVADYPGGGRVGCANFSIADHGYVGLGDDGSSFHTDLWEYDPVTDDWTQKANVSAPNKSFASCVSIGDQGYMLGGESANLVFTNSMRRYDRSTDSWSVAYNFTGSARRYGIFYLLDQTFYYGLGQTGASDASVIDDFWELLTDVGIDALNSSNEKVFRLYPSPATVGGTVTLVTKEPGDLVLCDALGVQVWSTHVPIGSTHVFLPGSLRGALAYRFTGKRSATTSTGLLLVH
jgi:N-acetylneuraminic acid mutarotase